MINLKKFIELNPSILFKLKMRINFSYIKEMEN